jgi:hypothetical protein
MIKLFIKTKLKSAGEESILINLFSKSILFIYRKTFGLRGIFNQTLFHSYSKLIPFFIISYVTFTKEIISLWLKFN